MLLPAIDQIDAAGSVLLAGCGGGFDVYAAIPIAISCLSKGQRVALANLSFSELRSSRAEKLSDTAWRVTAQSSDLDYFPERWLCEWLALNEMAEVPVFAFEKSGVEPLKQAYSRVIETCQPDVVLLIDAGTDSIIFGDEPGLGTVVEDAVSLVAGCEAAGPATMLACVGFGIDHFHGVSHHAFLENVARLSRSDGYTGGFSPAPYSSEVAAFLDLVDYANARRPAHKSIVANSIASAFRGEFGNYHATHRTVGSELFISPLMTQYWFFNATSVVEAMRWGADLSATKTFTDAERVIADHRDEAQLRARLQIPL